MREKSLSNATYVRGVERHWSRKLGRAVVLSPRDYALLSDWHLRGVPLDLVREALDSALGRRAGSFHAVGLPALRSRVEEAWSVVSGGRLGTEPAARDAACRTPATLLDRWRLRADIEGPVSPLGALLRGLLERLDRGEDRAAIDAQLSSLLFGAIDSVRLERVRGEMSAKLAPYRRRMDRERLESTISRACLSRLRDELGLPSLLDEETTG